MTTVSIRLTELAHGGGCACKIRPADLAQVLRNNPSLQALLPQHSEQTDSPLLVGLSQPDDAAVVRWPGAEHADALVLTTDFFTPLVDDPYVYGQIAATNAISDVFAMGGEPLFALNIVAFPTKTVPLDVLGKILEGGAVVCHRERVLLLGGHTVDDPEPKYGLSVVGRVAPNRIWTKQGAKPGDVLILSKPLGTGVMTNAFKKSHINEQHETYQEAVQSMCTSNRRAMELARHLTVNAATDITGYGLLGHLGEMLRGTSVNAHVNAANVRSFKGILELIAGEFVPGGSRSNLRDAMAHTLFGENVSEKERLLLADAQSSGGLLFSMPPHDGEHFVREFGATASIIGHVEPGNGTIHVKNECFGA